AASALIVLGLDDFLAAVVAARADVVTQMRFAGGRLDGQRRIAQRIVRAMHAALRRRLLVLLDSHFGSSFNSLLPDLYTRTASCTACRTTAPGDRSEERRVGNE